MRSPALAIAWEFRQRHRWGLIAVAGYVLVLGTIRLFEFESSQPINLDGSENVPGMTPRFAATVVVPLTSAFLYCLAVFSFGFAGDVAARRSMYPARMFVLPVSSAALAGWPMLYGTAAVASLWLATTRLALWPSGVDVPLIWPAAFAAVFLAWTQVLTWMPYGLPGLRVLAAVLWLVVIDIVALLAIHYQPAEILMVTILAPQLPLAHLAARFAVARARRGDVPDWRETLARRRPIAGVVPRRRDRFDSPARAQRWFEWRQHGRSLPVWVGILLPFELALLFVAGNDTPALVVYTLCGVLLTPPVMAAFAAPTVRRSNLHGSDSYAMAPFIATRPLTSAALVAAKLRTTIWSTLVAWLLVLVAIPVALTLSGTWPVVIERARQVSDAIGTPRAVAIVLLGFSGLVVWTWKQLVQSLYIGLSGREWLIRSGTCLTLAVLIFIEPMVQWIRENSDVRVALWNALPWIAAALVGVKMSAAAWIAIRLVRGRLLSGRTLVAGAAGWSVAVFALYGLLVWLVATPFFPRHLLALVAILAMPLARLSAAPLALAWNRHR